MHILRYNYRYIVLLLIILLSGCSLKISKLSQYTIDKININGKCNKSVVVLVEDVDYFVYIPDDIKKIVNNGLDKYHSLKWKNIYYIGPNDLGGFLMIETAKDFFQRTFSTVYIVDNKSDLADIKDYDLIVKIVPTNIINESKNINKSVNLSLSLDVYVSDRNDNQLMVSHYIAKGVGILGAFIVSEKEKDNNNLLANVEGIRISLKTIEDEEGMIEHKNNLYGKYWPAVDNHKHALNETISNFFDLLANDLYSKSVI